MAIDPEVRGHWRKLLKTELEKSGVKARLSGDDALTVTTRQGNVYRITCHYSVWQGRYYPWIVRITVAADVGPDQQDLRAEALRVINTFN